MAFDQPTRNRLARFVGDARALLSEEFTRQLQLDYGLDPETGAVAALEALTHLDDSRRETARILRTTLAHYLAGQAAPKEKARADAARREVLGRIVREQAYTVLNRLCALRMAEARGLLIESIARGYQSKGFQLYARLAGTALGETGDAYRSYLFSLFDEFAVDLAVLFDRFSPQGRLFPREAALLGLLNEINHPEITSLWAEDETIGWLYQFFNPKGLRNALKEESKIPRNSYELSVRSSFYTPRFVVCLLVENTLGRIWYEMTQGHTVLKESCRYLVRQPREIFLAEGETAPVIPEPEEGLFQEALLQQPVYIPYRVRKDPREIRMLDPACGSMHFGLYAFDLFERIYEEAWDWEASERASGSTHRPGTLDRRLPTADRRPLIADYPDKAALLRDVPRLVIEHNIHGIDIDPRAAQIAGLSLWLRAQRSWQAQGLKPQERPQIRRSNVVCAEPMPGDKALLAEFTATLPYKVLGQLVERIFDKMALAGEAGSLLKIEEELTEAVEQARQAYNASRLQEKQAAGYLPGLELARAATLFDFADLPADAAGFWDEAEARVLTALEAYAEQAQNGSGYQRRLFAQDAARGFAFIDVCRKHYDIVLANPPFSETEGHLQSMLKHEYPDNWTNLYSAFIERSLEKSEDRIGLICLDGFLSAYRMKNLRQMLVGDGHLEILTCLGKDVFDEMGLGTIAMSLNTKRSRWSSILIDVDEQGVNWLHNIARNTVTDRTDFILTPELIRASSLDWHKTALDPDYATVTQGNRTFDDFRFTRVWWEIPSDSIYRNWQRWQKGGEYQPFFSSTPYVMAWDTKNEGQEIRSFGVNKVGTDAQVVQSSRYWWCSGLVGPALNTTGAGFNVRVLPEGQIFSAKSTVIVPKMEEHALVLLFLINSKPVRWFLYQQGAGLGGNTGKLKKVPIVLPHSDMKDHIAAVVTTIVHVMKELESFKETSPCFLDCVRPTSALCESYRSAVDELDQIASELYQHIDIPSEVKTLHELAESAIIEATDGLVTLPYGGAIVSYCLGLSFGRWKSSNSVNPLSLPQESSLFISLPVCPPGMLQNAAGLPALPEDVPTEYPLRISWPGILVDDAGHVEDIEGRVREALRVIWGERADAIEQEACAILGVPSLRAYFANPARFFDEHLKRYSKSRRAAPIYWPLSTPSGSYTLWLYYHRLTDQTLYTCVNDFVDPKLQALTRQLNGLRGKTRRSSDDERELERLSTLELELQGFREELLRLAAFWKPNLNDGVQITAAPLWRLFQHRGWQQRLRETWEKLEAGEYDWAYLALSLWPERVIPACARDRSFAIAHEVEALFWVEDGGKWRALGEPEAEIATQKQRLLQCNRESTRALLEALAEGPAQGVPAYQVCQHLTEGAWDDLPIARHFWPERVTEKLWDEPQLALQAGMFLPDKRTQAARKRFLKEQLASGAPELAGAFIAAFQDVEAPFEQAWAALARGAHDAQPLALALWPERVLEKCLYDVELAAAHDLRRFFWVQGADGEWRRRKKLRQEIQEEVERRRK